MEIEKIKVSDIIQEGAFDKITADLNAVVALAENVKRFATERPIKEVEDQTLRFWLVNSILTSNKDLSFGQPITESAEAIFQYIRNGGNHV